MERWQPYREAMSLRDAMDRLFQDSWVNYPNRAGAQASMMNVSVDVHETDNGYELCAALPGWKPEDINITVHGDTVTISGQHKADEQRQADGRQYHLRERRFGSFARSFSFPGPIDANNAQARYENGELVLTIPKAEAARPRRIQVTGGQGARSMGTQTASPQMPTQPNQPQNREMAGATGRPGSGGQGTAGQPITVQSEPKKPTSRARKSAS